MQSDILNLSTHTVSNMHCKANDVAVFGKCLTWSTIWKDLESRDMYMYVYENRSMHCWLNFIPTFTKLFLSADSAYIDNTIWSSARGFEDITIMNIQICSSHWIIFHCLFVSKMQHNLSKNWLYLLKNKLKMFQLDF